jgi:hypothetical protein
MPPKQPQRFQPNPNKVEPPRLEAPLVPDETQEQTQARLKRTIEAVQKILRDNRAIISVNNIRLVDGRIIPEISIQVLK